MACRLADPGPVAITIGSIPRMKASEVINFVFGEFHNQNGVLRGKTDKHYQTNLEVGVIFQTAEGNTSIRSQNGYRK